MLLMTSMLSLLNKGVHCQVGATHQRRVASCWLLVCFETLRRFLRSLGALSVWFNTTNTRRCVALFVTLGFAYENPTHLLRVRDCQCRGTAKTQKEAWQNPAEPDFPRFLRSVILHESQKSCSLLEMGTMSRCPSGPGASSSFLVSERLQLTDDSQHSTANIQQRTFLVLR